MCLTCLHYFIFFSLVQWLNHSFYELTSSACQMIINFFKINKIYLSITMCPYTELYNFKPPFKSRLQQVLEVKLQIRPLLVFRWFSPTTGLNCSQADDKATAAHEALCLVCMLTLTYLGCCLHGCTLSLLSFHPAKTKMKSTDIFKISSLTKQCLSFLMLTVKSSPLAPMWGRRAVRVGSFLVKSGFLLLLFGDGRQQSASLVFVLLQERLRLFLRQLHILQLFQQVALLLWKTAAHWRGGGKFKLWKHVRNDVHVTFNLHWAHSYDSTVPGSL